MTFRLFDVNLSPQHRAFLTNGNRALGRLRAARKARLVRASYPGLASWALDSFIQYGIYRMVALGTGMTAEWNKRRFLNTIVLSRAVLETVGAWFRVLDDTFKLLPTEDIRRIHQGLMVAMFGSRTLVGTDGALPSAINALTGIDRLNKAYPGTRGIYDEVCEYVHPNCQGYMIFGEPDGVTGDTCLDEHRDPAETGIVTAATAGAIYLDIADALVGKYQSLFRKKVEALDKKFGSTLETWPGDASDGWRRK